MNSNQIPLNARTTGSRNSRHSLSKYRRCISSIALLATPVLVTGCLNDPSIKAAGAYSKKLEPKVKSIPPQLAGYIADSCQKIEGFQNPNSRSLSELRLVGDGNTRTVPGNKNECQPDRLKSISKNYGAAHGAILGYVATIGRLAGVNTLSVGPQAAKLAGTIKSFPDIDTDTEKAVVDAAGSFASILTRIYTDSYRKAELRNAVTESDKPLIVLISALHDSIEVYYLNGVLKTERDVLQDFYANPIRFGRQVPSNNQLKLIVAPYIERSLITSLYDANTDVNKKEAFVKAYLKLLEEVSCDHTKLSAILNDQNVEAAALKNSLCSKSMIVSAPRTSSIPSRDQALKEFAINSSQKYVKLLSRLTD